MRLSRFIALITALALISPLQAVAANLGISPIGITALPHDRSASLTLTNNGDDAIRMQATVFAWSAGANGEDVRADQRSHRLPVALHDRRA
jgi:P pilus assembly chaperone PapD